MNVCNLELAKELFELSSWEVTDYKWEQWVSRYHDNNLAPPQVASESMADRDFKNGLLAWQPIPAYDLGYLLRKLPEGTRLWRNKSNPRKRSNYKGEWGMGLYSPLEYGHSALVNGQQADTPEDCAAKMCIELVNQGIL